MIRAIFVGSILFSMLSWGAEPEDFLNGRMSGSVKLATDYVFRGESETADGDIAAVQLDLTWTHESNVYLGLFTSSNKFTSAPDVSSVVAPYVGRSGKLFDAIDYNFFVFHYLYPNARELDYTELWLMASKRFQKLTIAVEVTPTLNDWFGVKDWQGVNYAVHPSYALADFLTLSASLGYQDLDGRGAEGWMHWNLGIKANYGSIDWDLRYHNSDIDRSHKVYSSKDGREIFDDRIVLGLSKRF